MHCICTPPWARRLHGVGAPPRDSHLCASMGFAFVCLHGHLPVTMGKSMWWFYFKENLKWNKKRSNIAYKLIICLNYKGKKCERNKGRSKIALICPIIKWRSCEVNKKRTTPKKTKQNKTNKTPQKRKNREKNKWALLRKEGMDE